MNTSATSYETDITPPPALESQREEPYKKEKKIKNKRRATQKRRRAEVTNVQSTRTR